ncbi:hypothetical protein BDZ89DRAFT_1069097 [Hymenopellis radicata]|nr:hypothetical protein BDZ89DRAFT_1069097 [Hymenopellis radicata]
MYHRYGETCTTPRAPSLRQTMTTQDACSTTCTTEDRTLLAKRSAEEDDWHRRVRPRLGDPAESSQKILLVPTTFILGLSPIKLLPPELLTHIFLSYFDSRLQEALDLADSSDRLEDQISIVKRAQNLFLQVCCKWRTTALSSPRLWNTVAICTPVNFSTTTTRDDYRRYLSSQTTRAGTLPIETLFFSYPGRPQDGFTTEDSIHLFQTVADLIPRTRRLILKFRFHDWLSHVSLKEASMPEALELVVSCQRGDKAESYIPWSRQLLSHIVHLKTLELWGPSRLGSCVDTGRLSNVRTVVIGSIYLSALLQMLQNAPSLEGLSIREVILDPLSMPNVLHNRLRRLRLELPTDRPGREVLDYLTLPSLTHLDYNPSLAPGLCWPRDNDVEFFARSGCMLKTLIVRNVAVRDLITEILASQTALVDLQLEDNSHYRAAGIPPQALDFLSRKGLVGGFPVPALECFRFSVHPEHMAAVQEFLEARMESGLEYCGIAVDRLRCPLVTAEWQAMIQPFLENGLDVELFIPETQ